ncbi:hypothetical protein M378DRAFT_73397, partial [Amanita muscaria Koide BX008]
AVTRNEEKYPEPESFCPERFFKSDGTLDDDTVIYAFGFGRRICPGRHMAELMVWQVIALALATFNISKAKDKNGNEIDVDPDACTDSFTCYPLPFECTITPRSVQAVSLVRGAASVARENLKE